MSETWTAIAPWLLRSAAGGGLLLLLAWALARRTRQPARQQRLGEWGVLAALLAALLCVGPAWFVVPLPLPADGAASPGAGPEVRPSGPSVGPEHSAAVPDEEVVLAEDPEGDHAAGGLHGSGAAASGPATPAPQGDGFPWAAVLARLPAGLAALYALAASLFLLRWLLGYAALARVTRSARPAPAGVARAFAALAPARRRPRLLVSSRLRVPVSCGVRRPTVILPAALCRAGDTPALRCVLAHELTHLARRDAWTCLLLALGQAVYFYLPWYWWLRRRVRLCQEFVADAAAARQAAAPADYAQLLLDLSSLPAAPPCAAGVSGHSRSDLFRRVTMLLHNPTPLEDRCPRRWLAAVAAGLLALAVVASGVGLRAASAADDKADPAQKEQPKKEEPRREIPRRPFEPPLRVELPDIEELMKRLPEGIDPEKMKQIQKEMEKVRGEMQKTMEQMRQQMRSMEAFRGSSFFNRLARPGDTRLGVRVEKPGDVLTEQLGLTRGQGVVIGEVTADSAAARAGLKANDILLELDGKAVPSEAADFAKMVEDIKPGTPVDAVVLRKGKKETVKGLTLSDAKQPARPGARIDNVRPLPMRILRGGAGAGSATTITRTNDQFRAEQQDNGLTIEVAGKLVLGKAQVDEIQITEDGSKTKYETLDKVPEKHRAKVRQLVDKCEAK
jgi:beta-lactamase regulating signal transducer with metallopeptidase domain